MIKLFLLFVLAMGTIWTAVTAQDQFWGSKDAYLGQTPPGDTPKTFAPLLLAPDSGIAMDRSAFSADGKEFYYCKAMHWFDANGSALQSFQYDGQRWKGPLVVLPGYFTPTLSMDGQDLYLSGPSDSAHSTVWVSHRAGKTWSTPEVYLKKRYGLYNFMPTRNGIAYVGSNGRQGSLSDFQTYDFCALRMGAIDTLIESLGTTVNTPGFDGDFYIAPDESYLIVSYKEKLDYECELGISFHQPDGSWTSPENLGPLINDGDAHRWGAYVSPDGKYLFYTRGTSEKDCHIYWVRFDRLLKKLRQKK